MKTSKSQARYTSWGSKEEHCSKCKHFRPPLSCTKVAGVISPKGWSRFFSPKARS